jgi:apolipoprotein N-acyltransferase
LLFVALSRVAGHRFRVFSVPVIWVAVEWLRAWGPFGVTGGDIGYSQVQLLPLIQIATFTSVYGVSFLVVLVNAALVDVGTALAAVRTKRTGINDSTELVEVPVPAFLRLVLVLALVAGCFGYGLFELRGSREVHSQASEQLKLALIQPNIDQKDKMNPAKVLPTFELQEEMTQKALAENPDIVIWPETAVFSYLLHDARLFPRIKSLAEEANAWLVMGTPHYIGKRSYNSIVSISPSGEVVSRYDKEQLVPFGEYLPFRIILYPVLKGVGYYDAEFSANPKPEPVAVKDLKLAAAICFESTFPDLIRKRVKRNSDFILLVTNDAWFNDSSAPYFHLNTGVFRAIENRKYFVQVGNSGFSAVIDPYGRILKRSRLNQREILTFEIPLS